MNEVREALRAELAARGHEVSGDTYASRGELYVKGTGDLAAALFEFKPSAAEAAATMYQGNWTVGMPPRFAVLPAEAAEEPDFELLEQMHLIPLLYDDAAGVVAFRDLDAALARLRG